MAEKSTEKSAKKPAASKPEKTEAKKAEKPAVEKTEKAKEAEKPETKKKPKKGLIWGIIGGVAAIALAVGAWLLLKPKDSSDPTASPSYSTSFFISDSGKYSLWNADGKRLSEEIYSSKSDFVGGFAMVRSGENYGIIKADGKLSVPYGTYKEITNYGGLYLAKTDNGQFLIQGNGKVLLSAEKITATAPSSTAGFAVVEANKVGSIYTYDGKLVAKTDTIENAEVKTASNDDYGLVFYNNRNYLFDIRTGKLISAFEGERYKFNDVTEDRTSIILASDDDEKKHKLFIGGRIYDLDEMKNYAHTQLGALVGYDSYSEIALLDDNYKVSKKVSSSLILKDYKNYAAKEDDKVVIYKNGEAIRTFDQDAGLVSGILYDDFYVIKSDGKYGIYDLNGNFIRGNYDDVWSLYDSNHHIAVSDEEDKYYLIDTSGRRITEDTYYRINPYKGGYVYRKESNGKRAIANKNGVQITDFRYEDTYYRSSLINRNIWSAKVETSKYDVIDADAGKILATDINLQTVNQNYFTAKNSDGKTEYYTFGGLKFYTTE